MISDEIDKAYVAGCIDCDGCIQITRRDRKTINRIQYNLDVSISNTSVAMMNYLNRIMDNSGTYENNKPYGKGTKICYTFVVTGNKALQLLDDVLQYMIGKRKQAMLGIAFQTFKGNHQGIKIDDGTNELLQLMYERMRLLKNTEPEEGVLLYS